MVADLGLANYGWLYSPDGSHHAQVLFKAGKAQEGYLMNEDILQQATHVMDILQEHYPSENHVFVFDNATTHLKQVDNDCPPVRCLNILPGMTITGESQLWSLMVKGNQHLTRMG